MSILDYFGLPENYSQHGEQVDQMNSVITWLMLVLFVGWSTFFVIALFKFWHKRNPKSSYAGVKNHVSTHIEIGVVVVEAVFLLGFAFPLWAERTDKFERVVANDPNAPRVRVVGQQYSWTYHYPGNDGVFGRTDNTLITGDNSLGIDPEDPNGDDDFISTSALRLPVGRDCILQVTSKDVIHNFAIVPMRIQQDCIPGKEIPMWFKPVKELETYVVCAQLCGEKHADMKGSMEVINAKEYYEWAKKRSDEELAKKQK
ncbi:cytochrome c oxidase subunit II [Verrucomicrobiaceae bacterium R5-34]|uniref:cytochrome-c oxidase n=1 Tax=Oceaniferula flava TaxID=2800421 RepID=A0AAE2S965_9BACT|nr:cytochrome c oxidase subunit II [Oceaniferula flavus]MBK1831695.1 cytochrome c oxidase subunit II [Verrucomicrobiaceae bacterium R5-34]MBK1853968.1 cytochrome c oxidase subunit II [Oceaniferula flavus]MBM1135274.1 cytochrome c oxidase subunit II [Oceaniferula flavus]